MNTEEKIQKIRTESGLSEEVCDLAETTADIALIMARHLVQDARKVHQSLISSEASIRRMDYYQKTAEKAFPGLGSLILSTAMQGALRLL